MAVDRRNILGMVAGPVFGGRALGGRIVGGLLAVLTGKAHAADADMLYLNAYASVAEAKAGIGSWLGFYNEERQHQSLGYRTPRHAYEAECPWICGRSAPPTGCAFAHIPTGTTANHRIEVNEDEVRGDAMTLAPGAIGAGTEIGRATP